MAVVLDPQETRPFWLASDADKPIATRPVFECIAGNRRIRRQHASVMDKAQSLRLEYFRLKEHGTPEEASAAEERFWAVIAEALFIGVVGWKNINKPFEKTLDAIGEVVETDADLIELARDWPIAGKLTDDDLKNSPSPRPTGAESSAPNAVAETATPTKTPTTA